MRIFVCLDSTHENNSKSIAKFLPFSKRLATPLSAVRLNSLVWNQIMAENYLNSYFKNSYSRESNIIAEFESGTRTYKSDYTGLKSEQTRNTLICLFMRFRVTFYCSLFSSQRTRVNKYPLFHSNALCFTNQNAIPQITAFLCIYSIFPDKSEK